VDGRRVASKYDRALVTRDEPFEFEFDGCRVRAYPGETVGAALTAAGITTFRTTRVHGAPRGLFCGIGVCFDCLVVVDGAPNQRACLTAALPDLIVQTQIGVAEDCFGG
jgi:hypothetical protein